MVAAFNTLLVDVAPTALHINKGLEFLNRHVHTLFKNNGIHQETKASIVERFNRTLKTRIWLYLTKHETWRYNNVLQNCVRKCNGNPHRSIGVALSQVRAANQEEVWQLLYRHDGKGVPKLRVFVNSLSKA